MTTRILALWALMTVFLCAATELPLTLALIGQIVLITGVLNVAGIAIATFAGWLLGIWP